ncbi:efflux RND transporter periplasmic adaptor subunit [Maribacter sp. CXY002]|uniref:efflux RND transporter periplasmic adaptor subunit n=1 Tax=Maribacter luteocoastalis TaxID=3407671 RepID=UPI003B670E32
MMYIHNYKITLISLVFIFFGCSDKEKSKAELTKETVNETPSQVLITQEQFDQLQMEIGGLEEKSFSKKISVNGMIDVPPENRAVVNATMGGYIKTTPYLIGDQVKKGQILVTLENPEYISLQQNYLEVHEQLAYLKAEYERHKIMQAEQITSQKNFLKAESDYRSAVAKHEGLKKQLGMLNIVPANVEAGNIASTVTITAPITGSITKVNVSKGTYVSPATSILEIIDNDHIHLELSVFEKDIMKISKGQPIEFSIPEASKNTFNAKVHLVGTSIDENRTIKVHGHLEDESKVNFLTGMFVEANIITDSTSAIALPDSAIIEVDGTPFVLQFDKKLDNTYYFNQKEVKIKESYNGYTRIENALDFEKESNFLTKGVYNLLGD